MSSVGLIEITAPQISLPTINCSPRMASSCEIIVFYYNIYHLEGVTAGKLKTAAYSADKEAPV